MKQIVIIGSGIIGLTIAYHLKRSNKHYHIRIIEKEPYLAAHASGRNSGVLHAGFYYSPDSLKAKFCREGQQQMLRYVKSNGLELNACGKLVVAQNESELTTLKQLYDRGQTNGVPLKWLSQKEAESIEPLVKTYQHALFSPSTATVNPNEILNHLYESLKEEGVLFHFGETFISANGKQVNTNKDTYPYHYLFNCAGTYAVDIAKQFGLANSYQVLPFKGLYLLYEGKSPLKTNIYPVPPKNAPFLGVHFTLTSKGQLKVGPTATPAFSYEHYHLFNRFSFKQALPIMYYDSLLFALNKHYFRNLAVEELKKYSKSYLAKSACRLSNGLNYKSFKKWTKPGIRAQLLHTQRLCLVDDFVIEKKMNSIHVLNVVSPGFTASFSFSKHIIDHFI